MADVQLEHGHLRLANRLVEAILHAPFQGTHVRILLALVRLTYGWKRRTARVSLEQLARHAGKPYTGGFRRALDELLAAGVVLEIDPGYRGQPTAYAIQKDHEQWGAFSVAAAALVARWSARPDHCDDRMAPGIPAPTGAPSSPFPAPEGADSLPLQGHHDRPYRGRKGADNSAADNELHAPKDSERHRKTTTTITDSARTSDGADSSLAVALTSAANRAITERWGEQPNPLRHDAGSTLTAAAAIAEGAVPGDFARDAVYTLVLECRLERPPRSLGYFTTAVIERWKAEEERRAAAASPAPNRLAVVRGAVRPTQRETIDTAVESALAVGAAVGLPRRSES